VNDPVDILIIGAGVSGVGVACRLEKDCPDLAYEILEARDDLGGTWDLFRYPGVRSDSDMYTFGYAFQPWQAGEAFADGPGIKAYVRETAEAHGVPSKIRFGQRVVAADWDGARAAWTLTVETAGGERHRRTCRFLVGCAGYYRYDRGHRPRFESEETFAGDIIHPQHWPERYDYAGKRVAIIGSGATAVTLLPAMAADAQRVTMIQRSPSYVAARPARDAFAAFVRRILPSRLAYGLARARNILLAVWFFQMSRRFPGLVKANVKKLIRAELGEDFDVETHFSPRYDPWDQRFCLAPDGDFFKALKSGRAGIRTGEIDRFEPAGVRLASGELVEADLVIPATGLEMQLLGGVAVRVDGRRFPARRAFVYRGMMISGLPNFVIAFGYANASWTLKVDLTAERLARLLNHMRRKGHDWCAPEPPGDLQPRPLLDFSSGYVRRKISEFPSQGDRGPWRTHQNYIRDMISIRFSPIEDGTLRFHRRARDGRGSEPRVEAAE